MTLEQTGLNASRILVTGSNGFVGRSTANRLQDQGYCVRGAVRGVLREHLPFEAVEVGDIERCTEWGPSLDGVTTVVHLAARAHIMGDGSDDPLTEFRRVNADGTANLVRQAVCAGVRRVVFLSSVKVLGEQTVRGERFSPQDLPAPEDPYAISKCEAEEALRSIAGERGLEVVIIRPPLVYGPAVKANFARLMRWVQRGYPLPFGAIDNRRSLVGLDNLVDLIATCVDHPAAAGQTFLVSDGEDISTPQLIRELAEAMGRRPRLLSVPPGLLRTAGALTGRRAELARLCGSLQVDITHTRRTLNWEPPVPLREGLRRAVQGMAAE